MRVMWLAVFLTAIGCSSAGSSGGGGQSCSHASDCTTWQCTCADGTTSSLSECAQHVCVDGNQACSGECQQNGGLVSVEPKPSVANTPECDAFCAKLQSLGCKNAECNRSLWCGLSQGECAEQKRAQLQCEADQGTWQCTAGGGWSMSGNGCPIDAQCPADAGTD